MDQLLKLDGIMVEGDVKLKRKIQVKRVQKYVETLDLLKIKNSLPSSNGHHAPVQHQQKHSNGQKLGPDLEQQEKHSNGHKRLPLAPIKEQQQQKQPRNSNENFLELYYEEQHQPSRNSTSGVVVTTNWELFDFAPPLIPVQSTSSPPPPPMSNSSGLPKFNWELFN
ncbi:BAG family molecular chaperone regulator 1-like [Vigna angularis]|uniref:BAG family molecular chaperone regulator 1-like n=1 Tax=Phaseolus angularis TaxID=3914 RepID=UPI000809F62C|nr:BAG family molecular chaperone regulator 1-like [Vigna angularis]